MNTSTIIRILLFTILVSAITGLVSATNLVQIYVQPGSGTVCLDNSCQVNVGTLQGTSSTQFQGVACGRTHTIRVYNTAGYEDYTGSVYVDYNCDDVTRSISLQPVATATETETPSSSSGEVQVYVSPGPAAAEICLDTLTCQVNDGPALDTWSVRFSDVSPGSHSLAVDANGYQSAAQQVSVTAGEISTRSISLVPVAVPANTQAPGGATPAGTTASPLAGGIVVLAAGAAGMLAVFRNRSR